MSRHESCSSARPLPMIDDRTHTSAVIASSRGRADGWAAHLPLAFVMIALVALVALPILADRYAEPLNRDLRQVVEPARGLITDIHVSLAIEGSAFHDYQDTRRL